MNYGTTDTEAIAGFQTVKVEDCWTKEFRRDFHRHRGLGWILVKVRVFMNEKEVIAA